MVPDKGHAEVVASAYTHWIAGSFVLGYLCHVLWQVNAAAKAPNNGETSPLKIIQSNSIAIFVRFVLSGAAFDILWRYPSFIPKGLGLLGMNVSDGVASVLTWPMVPVFALLYGYAMDSILAFIPKLKNYIPPPIDVAEPAAPPVKS